MTTPSRVDRLSRRRFIQSSALAVGAGAGLLDSVRGASAAQPPAVVTRPGDGAKNLIFLMADGMSAGGPALLDQFGRYTGSGLSALTRLAMGAGVRRALQSTHAADAAVTDSAAASSAWSTGVKHNSGQLCLSTDGRRLSPLLERAREAGKRTGCVTTTTITHATPAGWYASIDDRGRESEIAGQLLEARLDVALGGGSRYFVDHLTQSRPALAVLRTQAALQAVGKEPVQPGQRVLGLFSEEHVPFAIERPANVPGLEEMSRFAVERLAALGGDGFVLQIEAGRVDHAAHRNDAAGYLRDLQEFDRTVAWVAEWVRSRQDTLLIITTDHATANPGLTFYGREGIDALRRLADARHSVDWILERAAGAATPAEGVEWLAAAVKDAVGVTLDEYGRTALTAALSKQAADPFRERRAVECVVGSLLGNELGVGWVSRNHTSDHVELLAMGAGHESMPAFIDNIALHDWMTARLGLTAKAG